jgi:hypothetical protein
MFSFVVDMFDGWCFWLASLAAMKECLVCTLCMAVATSKYIHPQASTCFTEQSYIHISVCVSEWSDVISSHLIKVEWSGVVIGLDTASMDIHSAIIIYDVSICK